MATQSNVIRMVGAKEASAWFATLCKRCGGPKRDFQVYCGAACSVLAEAGK